MTNKNKEQVELLPCLNCNGRGRIIYPPPDDRWVQCHWCGGAGKGVRPQPEPVPDGCKHAHIVSARNKHIAEGLYCPDCNCLFSEDMKHRIAIISDPPQEGKEGEG